VDYLSVVINRLDKIKQFLANLMKPACGAVDLRRSDPCWRAPWPTPGL